MKRSEIDLIEDMYALHHHRCFVTKKQATQRAHIIGNTKANRHRYGDEIIDDPLNWLPAHDLYNNGLIDLGKNHKLLDHAAEMIKSGDRIGIETLVALNVARKKDKTNE